MSVEVWLHPDTATKKQLVGFLRSLGYQPCQHLLPWGKGAVHFHWFEADDYKSFDGVEATVYKPQEDPHRLGPCAWALHTRTRSSGSPSDKQFQIDTINQARRQFGGHFYNDWGSRNRHMKAPPERRDAASRGLYMNYEAVKQHIDSVKFALPPEHEQMKKMAGTPLADMARMDPARVIYNALVPFAAASLEGFFGEAFTIMIRYDAGAQAYLTKQNRKIEFDDARAIASGQKRIEEVIAGWYSFQNVSSLQKAFSEWLGVDLWKVLRGAAASDDANSTLDQAFEKIVATRHKIIHGLQLDYDIDRARIVAILDDAARIVDAFVDHLEKDTRRLIRDETLWALDDAAPSSEQDPPAV